LSRSSCTCRISSSFSSEITMFYPCLFLAARIRSLNWIPDTFLRSSLRSSANLFLTAARISTLLGRAADFVFPSTNLRR
jgi:hypothetical protein